MSFGNLVQKNIDAFKEWWEDDKNKTKHSNQLEGIPTKSLGVSKYQNNNDVIVYPLNKPDSHGAVLIQINAWISGGKESFSLK